MEEGVGMEGAGGRGWKDKEEEDGSGCRDSHPDGVGAQVKYCIRITKKDAFVTGHQCVTRSQLVPLVTYSANDNVFKSL